MAPHVLAVVEDQQWWRAINDGPLESDCQTATGCSMIPVGTSANITEER